MNKLPSQFQCMGMTVDVFVEDHDSDTAGHFYPEDSKITIAPSDNPEYQMITFWHEYLHCVFGSLGYEKLNKDERLIDQMAHCLHQLMKTYVVTEDSDNGQRKAKRTR